MSEAPVLEPEQLALLNDSAWRRLGLSQIFDQLLVRDLAVHPASSDVTRDRIGEHLQAGAAKFWALSFPQLKKALLRRDVLVETDGTLSLTEAFHGKMIGLVDEAKAVLAQNELPEGLTLQDVLDRQKEREAKAKPKPAVKRKPAPTSTGIRRAKAPKGTAAPLKRARSESSSATASDRGATTKTKLPQRAPKKVILLDPKKLFTSLKMNRLLDALDNAKLSAPQLADRLDLGSVNMRRFIDVATKLEILRGTDELIELHWKGRELARTASADRRMALIQIVKDLRAEAAALDD